MKMSRATRHLERLIRALQSDSLEGGEGQEDISFRVPPSSVSAQSRYANPLDKETPRSSRVSLGFSTLNSESDDTTVASGGDGTRLYREEAERLVQHLGDSRVQVATLEAQVEFLTQKKEEQEARDSLYIQRLEEEVLRLEEQVEHEMSNLTRRQTKVEQEAPGLEEQLRSLKDVLHEFNVSEPLYLELKAIPEQRRTAREQILMLAYEKFQQNREEIQELRMSRDTSREALTRANDEVQKLTRELQRVSANHASERRESELDLSASDARIERLEAEHRDFLVQIELLTAKGALYDEMKGKLENLESTSIDAENQKAVMAATLQVAMQEKESLRDSIKEKDHTLDLLSMDKIYLAREVQTQSQQVKKLEAELERQHEKVREVKRGRTELYNKVLLDNKDSQTANEQRLQAEILRIQERTNQDIELIRKEAIAVADEKVRTFREMRDSAMAAAESAGIELRDSKAAYDELLLKYRELQRVTELRESENHCNLKVMNFDLDRLKVVLEETKNALDQTRLENEVLVAKVKILKEKHDEVQKRPIEELKNALEKPLCELREDLRATRAQLEVYREQPNSASTSRADPLIGSTCQSKESVNENPKLEGKLKGYLPEAVPETQRFEGKLKEGVHENQDLEHQLRCVTEEKERVSSRLQSVQEDIRKLLRARGSVEQLQIMLQEKGVPLGANTLKAITTSSKIRLQGKTAVAPQHCIDESNMLQSSSPTYVKIQKMQKMMESRESPLGCPQHKHCPSHYPKPYLDMLNLLSSFLFLTIASVPMIESPVFMQPLKGVFQCSLVNKLVELTENNHDHTSMSIETNQVLQNRDTKASLQLYIVDPFEDPDQLN